MKNFLKICFIGYGSIAKRHISNLNNLLKIKNINYEIDIYRHKPNLTKCKYVTNYYFDDKEVLKNKYDIIFITNPTSEHYKSIIKFKKITKFMFVEKPLVAYKDLNKIERMLNSKRIYIACPLRYTRVIQYLKEKLLEYEVYSVRAICSSYLPDWRPNTDYKKTYSANKKLGGGVRLDLIHEMDYLKYLFGKPLKVVCNYGKYSNLNIDSEDLASYTIIYKNKLIELHIDYFGRKSIRELDIFTNYDTINVNLINGTIKFLKNNEKIVLTEDRDDYQIRELDHFVNIVLGIKKNDNDIKNAIDTIKLTRGNL